MSSTTTLSLAVLLVPAAAVAVIGLRWWLERSRFERRELEIRHDDLEVSEGTFRRRVVIRLDRFRGLDPDDFRWLDLDHLNVETGRPKDVDTEELVAKAPPRASTGDDVDVSVFGPPRAAVGEDFLVQVVAHRPEQSRAAARLAALADPEAQRRGVRSLDVPIELGGVLDIELGMPGLAVDDPVQKLKWSGRAEAVQFGVGVPPDFAARSVIGTVTVSRQGIPIGSLRWKLAVESSSAPGDQEPQGDWVSRFRHAFISYATPDRKQVLARVQMLRAVGIDFFQDVLNLEPGERWERELYRQIEQCDVFLLFWSTAAKESDWVRKETHEALRLADASGASERPTLRPILIEGPPVPRPWPELAHLHFNDKVLYVMDG